MQLHPQAQALLRLFRESGIPPTHTLSPKDARVFYRVRATFTAPEPPDVASVNELEARGPHGGIPLRYYRPSGSAPADELPVLVYFHGGGWVIGDLDTHDTLCRELANGSGCAVVAVDYRLAPEHRFPAGVDDSLAALQWVHAHAGTLGIDGTRIAVGGDSAGGNLAAVVALAARDAGGPEIAFQLLIYPATDQRCESASHQARGQGYMLTADLIEYYARHYFDEKAGSLDWRASPLLAADHRNLPSGLVLVAGFDPLHDEGVAYAQKLSEAGNRVSLVDFPRQMHGFITAGKVIDEASTAVQLCSSQLKRALVEPRSPRR